MIPNDHGLLLMAQSKQIWLNTFSDLANLEQAENFIKNSDQFLWKTRAS